MVKPLHRDWMHSVIDRVYPVQSDDRALCFHVHMYNAVPPFCYLDAIILVAECILWTPMLSALLSVTSGFF